MANEKIMNLQKRLADLRKDIADECERWKHNCQACTYERLCGDEAECLEKQLKDAYCEETGHDCSKCEHLKKCDSIEARTEIRRQKHQQHLDDCAACGSDCTKCMHLWEHCSFDKGHQMWLELSEKACEEPYGCRKCPMARTICCCDEEKFEHYQYLAMMIYHRKFSKK